MKRTTKAVTFDILKGVALGLLFSGLALALAYPLALTACHFAPGCIIP